MAKILFLVLLLCRLGHAQTCLDLTREAQALAKQGQLDQSLRVYFKALACNPNVIEAQFGAPLPAFALPKGLSSEREWKKGEPIEGQRLLVYGVKGNGDTLQFARFLPLLIRTRVKQVIFVPQKSLATLMRSSFANQPFIEIPEETDLASLNDRFDKHVALLSLPHYLDLGRADLKADSYLRGPEEVQRDLTLAPEEFHIGVVFSGDSDHPHNADRSFTPKDLTPLMQLKGVRFYSLQPGSETFLQSTPGFDLRFLPALKTYLDTARIIQNLDLVLTADTSVSHLSAALGQTTFVPLAKHTDLRYAGEEAATPWYPCMKLFRQKTKGRWTQPMRQIKKEVQLLITKKQQAR